MTRRPTAEESRGSSGGIGRSTSAAAERVSDDLRLGGGDLLRRRRLTGALVLSATRLRRRLGAAGLWAWRVGRYLRLGTVQGSWLR